MSKNEKGREARRRTMMTTKTATTTTTTLRLWIATIALCAIFGIFHGFSKLEFWFRQLFPISIHSLVLKEPLSDCSNCARAGDKAVLNLLLMTVFTSISWISFKPLASASESCRATRRAPSHWYVTGEEPSAHWLGVTTTKPPKNTTKQLSQILGNMSQMFKQQISNSCVPLLISSYPLSTLVSTSFKPLSTIIYTYVFIKHLKPQNQLTNLYTMFFNHPNHEFYRLFIILNWPFCIMSTLD